MRGGIERRVTGVARDMTTRPGPRPLPDEALSHLLAAQRFGTLATVKRSGHPHLSTMGYAWDADARVLRFSTTADRVKVAHLRRDPHAALHVQGGDVWSFAVAEGRPSCRTPRRSPATRSAGSCSASRPASPAPTTKRRSCGNSSTNGGWSSG